MFICVSQRFFMGQGAYYKPKMMMVVIMMKMMM